MLGNYQRHEVTVKFSFDAEVFPEDPDDVFELAKLEEKSVAEALSTTFDEVEIEYITVEPIIELLAK
jgi:hypothetical protein